MLDKLNVHVCGDLNIDWLNLHCELQSGTYFWNDKPREVRTGSLAGGAALIRDIIRHLSENTAISNNFDEIKPSYLKEPISDITTSWTTWKAITNECKEQPSEGFRISSWNYFNKRNLVYNNPDVKPDLLIIHDGNLGFRDLTNELLALKNLRENGHVILKMYHYENDLWKDNKILEQLDKYKQQTTVITRISDLRTCEVSIEDSLSWEKIFSDIISAIHCKKSPFYRHRFHRVIVLIGNSGAVISENDNYALIYDQGGQEGDFARRLTGEVIGNTSCIAAALAAGWINNQEKLDWVKATRLGLRMARLLHLKGFITDDQNRLCFPHQLILDAFNIEAGHLNEASICDDAMNLKNGDKPSCDSNTANDQVASASDSIYQLEQIAQDYNISEDEIKKAWSLGTYMTDSKEKSSKWTIFEESKLSSREFVRQIVLNGPQQELNARNIPIEEVGMWRSADRHEIEGVRKVRNALRDYINQNKQKSQKVPLSVAVFGPPGAGKSFTVNQIAMDLNLGSDDHITFNVSQFIDVSDLFHAFHRIRDFHINGKIPVVFWDEFDTQRNGTPMGWLQYFLAPMQDGVFFEKGLTHPVGAAIYIFAGATCESYSAFCNAGSEDQKIKKPDFISRLRAYIDVRGPNADKHDKLHIIRRACLLNQALEKDENGRINVQKDVVDFFLWRVDEYKYGTRSMRTLVNMSNLTGKRRFELSSLPPKDLQSMHILKTKLNIGIVLRIQEPLEDELLVKEITDVIDQMIDGTSSLDAFNVFCGFDNVACQLACMTVIRILQKKVDTVYIVRLNNEDALSELENLRREFGWLPEKTEIKDLPVESKHITVNKMRIDQYIAQNSDQLIILKDNIDDDMELFEEFENEKNVSPIFVDARKLWTR